VSVRRIECTVDISGHLALAAGTIAVTVVAPAGDVSGPRTVMVAFPGASYSRHYWDIQWPGLPGYSQAEFHAERGWIVAMVDHLGVGDSSNPDGPVDLVTSGKADAAAAHLVLDGLRAGTLDSSLPPIEIAQRLGVGQSMGGAFLTVAQATGAPFDAIAILGTSVVRTEIPTPDGGAVTDANADDLNRNLAWSFHLEDVPAELHEADITASFPAREHYCAPWGSRTMPEAAFELMTPGILAADAAAITCPVLIAFGERDLCHDPWDEPGAFRSSPDVTLVVMPGMAHMHNFARTREKLWRRLDGWLGSVAAGLSPVGGS
jgi:alpha-beta hydrolase superfamily lysophospholipase